MWIEDRNIPVTVIHRIRESRIWRGDRVEASGRDAEEIPMSAG
jgi:hypothetical protein